jgi:hypothetical protein
VKFNAAPETALMAEHMIDALKSVSMSRSYQGVPALFNCFSHERSLEEHMDAARDTFRGQAAHEFRKVMSEDGFVDVADIQTGLDRWLNISARSADNAVLCAHFEHGRLFEASVEYRTKYRNIFAALLRDVATTAQLNGQVVVHGPLGLRVKLAITTWKLPPHPDPWTWSPQSIDHACVLPGVMTEIEERLVEGVRLWDDDHDAQLHAVCEYRRRIDAIEPLWKERLGILDIENGTVLGRLPPAFPSEVPRWHA